MKKYVLLVVCFSFSILQYGQSVIGAWEGFTTNDNGDKHRHVVIFADGYQVLSTYNAESGKFIHSNGGTWSLDGDIMTEKVEFHTDDPTYVGKEFSFQIKLTE